MINTTQPQTDFIALKHAFETECTRLEPFLGSIEKARTHAILKLFDGLTVQETKRALMEAYRAIEVETRLSSHALAMRYESTVFVDETKSDETTPDNAKIDNATPDPTQDTPQDETMP